MVAVAAGTEYGGDVCPRFNGTHGLKDIGDGIGRMRVIDYDGHLAGGVMEGLETSGHRHQRRYDARRLAVGCAQQGQRGVYRQQIIGVETPRETCGDICRHAGSYGHLGASEVALDDAGGEIGRRARQRVCLHRSHGVLSHHGTVGIVYIGECPCRLGQQIKETLLGTQIFTECPVVVKVVTSDVGKNAAGKMQSGGTILCHAVA